MNEEAILSFAKSDREEVVYISGSYSKGSWGGNVSDAIRAAEEVYSAGYIPFIPHTHTALWSLMQQKEKEDWLRIDFAFIDRSDYLIRLEGYSAGGDAEMEYAEMVGVPVYEGVGEFLEEEGHAV